MRFLRSEQGGSYDPKRLCGCYSCHEKSREKRHRLTVTLLPLLLSARNKTGFFLPTQPKIKHKRVKNMSTIKRTTTTGTTGAAARKPAATAVKGDGVTKRLQSELMGLMTSGDKGATAFPDGDNLFKWVGTLKGGDDTAFEGLVYKLELKFPPEYPFSPPTITFTTPCFHPNVDDRGNICLDILKDKWSASLSVSAVLQSLRSLLGDPNNDSPLNGQAAAMWHDQKAFREQVLKVHRGA